ncbi:MAG: hypothetical protein CL677_09240 [Bdellovibrionaceae bacterium]|nr:hypothetical protein [Pseudobdellovibrionaceae bacterium]|tara:strand:+ start:62762 stop:63664 length:903 start_codon:yes stop_codon:yes gene_type:complete
MKTKTIIVAALAMIMGAALPSMGEIRGINSGIIDSSLEGIGSGFINPGRGHQQNLQRVRIPLNQHLQGYNTLHLKQLVRRQTGMNLQHFDLVRVNLVAKSRHGQAQAKLFVGHQLHDQVTVQSSRNFYNDRPASFNPHVLIARDGRRGNRRNNQTWQLDLQGNVKVKNLIVVVERKQMGPGGNLRLQLSMNTIIRGGQNIGLKRELRQQHNINLNNYKLVRVNVKAKSRQGHATAELFVAGQSQDMSRIAASSGNFQSPGGFDNVILRNHDRYRQQGAWKLSINGRVNLNKITVVLQPLH